MYRPSISADTVRVAIRLRPLNERERSTQGNYEAWQVQNSSYIYNSLADGRPTGSSSGYVFDKVFVDQDNSQVYQELARDVIQSFLEGMNGTIFAYGQTSSGKTFTMQGVDSQPGVIPLAVNDIFHLIHETPDREYLLRVSYLEIYNEIIRDLLTPGNDNLKIHETTSREIFVGNLTEEIVMSPEDVSFMMKRGEGNRHVGVTNMNERSSRSHTIFRLVLESRDRGIDDKRASLSGAVRVSSLNLVDLAGSERVGHTGAEGIRLKEGGHINKSLLTLGTVIGKLSEGIDSHVPYRDSKLTRILQPSLGGNARTAIVCTITPSSAFSEETLSTLKFASRAKTIRNTPEINEIVSEEVMLKRYRKEINNLKKQLEQLQGDDDIHEHIQSIENEKRQAMEENEINKRNLEEFERDKRQLQDKIDKMTRLIINNTSSADTVPPSKKQKILRRKTWFPGTMSLVSDEVDDVDRSANVSVDLLQTPTAPTTLKKRDLDDLVTFSRTFEPTKGTSKFDDMAAELSSLRSSFADAEAKAASLENELEKLHLGIGDIIARRHVNFCDVLKPLNEFINCQEKDMAHFKSKMKDILTKHAEKNDFLAAEIDEYQRECTNIWMQLESTELKNAELNQKIQDLEARQIQLLAQLDERKSALDQATSENQKLSEDLQEFDELYIRETDEHNAAKAEILELKEALLKADADSAQALSRLQDSEALLANETYLKSTLIQLISCLDDIADGRASHLGGFISSINGENDAGVKHPFREEFFQLRSLAEKISSSRKQENDRLKEQTVEHNQLKSNYEQLQANFLVAQDNLLIAKDHLANLEESRNELLKQIDIETSGSDQLRSRLEHMESQLSDANRASDNCQVLTVELLAKSQQLQILHAELKKSKEQKFQLMGQVEIIKAEYQCANESSKEVLNQFRAHLNALSANLHNVVQPYVRSMLSFPVLEEQNSNLLLSLSNMREHCKNLENDRDEMQVEIERLTAENEHCEQAIVATLADNEQLQDRCSTLGLELRELSDLRQQLNEMRIMKEESERIEQKGEELVRLQEFVDRGKIVVKDLSALNENLKESIAEMKNDALSARESHALELTEAHDAISSQKASIEALQTRIVGQEREVQQAHECVKKLEDQLDDQNALIEALQETKHRRNMLQNQCDSLDADLRNVTADKIRLEAEMAQNVELASSLEFELEKARMEAKSIGLSNMKLEDDLKEKMNALIEMRVRYDQKLEDVNNELAGERADHQLKIKEIEKEYSDRFEKLQSDLRQEDTGNNVHSSIVKEQLAMKECEVAALERDLIAVTADRESMQSTISAKDQEISKYRIEIESLKQEALSRAITLNPPPVEAAPKIMHHARSSALNKENISQQITQQIATAKPRRPVGRRQQTPSANDDDCKQQ
eukprot:Partr_v1_DN28758_c1_g2_i3_m63324 putative Kinesin family